MLLHEIDDRWRQCQSDVQREILWAHLTQPSGRWFECLHELSDPTLEIPASTTALLEEWLKDGGSPSPANFYRPGFSPSCQMRLLRACYQCALLAKASRDAVPPNSAIKIIADNAELAPGLVADLIRHVAGKQLQPAHASMQLIVLLVNDDHDGVPATLTLECIAKGTGALYPAPRLCLSRDQTFMQAERLAADNLSTTSDIDVRWSLQRLDGELLGHLTGASIGGAFALGLHCLVNSPSDIEPGYLAQVAVSAALDEAGKFIRVGGLWEKLDHAAMQLANLHTLVVATDQADIPPSYLNETASPLVIQANDLADTLQQLQQKSLPWRALRGYEQNDCNTLEFRLPGTSAPIATHYQVLPLYREIEQPLTDITNAQPGVILQWEDTVRGKTRHYQPIALAEAIADTYDAGHNIAARLLVLGSPGSGKTTLIQYLAWAASMDMLFEQSLVPVRIRLRDWERWAHANPETRLHDFLNIHYRTFVQEVPSPQTWRDWLNHGRVLLLIDGVDEIEDEEWFRRMLRELLDYQQTTLILTARTVAFRLYEPQFEAFTVHWLGPLQIPQRDAYIQAYPARHGFDRTRLIEQLNSNSALQRLAENPLLLSIICFAVDDPAHPRLPETRAALYGRFVDSLLARPERIPIDYPAEPPPLRDKKRILAHAALCLLGRHRFSFSADDLAQALGVGLEKAGYGTAPAPWANALAKDLIGNSALLRGYRNHSNTRDNMQFFLHAMVQEYLSAYALTLLLASEGCDGEIQVAGTPCSIRNLVSGIAWSDPHWVEIVGLLGEILESNINE